MSTITATAGRRFTAYLEGAPSGIASWQVRIYDTTDAVVSGPALDDLDTLTPGVVETAVNPEQSLYSVELVAPTPATGYAPDTSGVYAYTLAWMSDGVESEPDALLVTLANVGGLTLAKLKRRLVLEGTVDDDKLQDYLDAALMQAQAPWPNGCGRLLVTDPPDPLLDEVQRTVQVSAQGRALIPDASVISDVTVNGATVELGGTDGYKTLTKDGYIVQLHGLAVDDTATEATVTGRFGFTTIPVNLANAIYALAGRYHYEEAAQYGDQVEILEGGAVQSYYRQLPPQVRMVFASYVVPMATVGLR